MVEISDDGERIEDALDRSGTAKSERPQELTGEQLHRAMPLDQFGRAVDRLGADEDFRLGESGAAPITVEGDGARKGVETIGVERKSGGCGKGEAANEDIGGG